MAATPSVTFGAIWREAGAVGERHGGLLISAMTILVVIELGTNFVTSRWAGTISNVLDIVALIVVTVVLLRADGLVEHEGRPSAYALVALLTGGGIMLGLIAFVVPGLYLLARWSLAQPLAVARNQGAIEAMRESWKLTRADAWTLVGVFAVFGLAAVLVLLTVGFVAAKLFGNTSAFSAVGLLSVANNVLLVTGACLGVAIYRQIVRPYPAGLRGERSPT